MLLQDLGPDTTRVVQAQSGMTQWCRPHGWLLGLSCPAFMLACSPAAQLWCCRCRRRTTARGHAPLWSNRPPCQPLSSADCCRRGAALRRKFSCRSAGRGHRVRRACRTQHLCGSCSEGLPPGGRVTSLTTLLSSAGDMAMAVLCVYCTLASKRERCEHDDVVKEIASADISTCKSGACAGVVHTQQTRWTLS